MSNVRTQIGKVIGKSLNGYHSRVKPKIDELKFKEQYQGRIIDCMVGEVDDNYIETPETDENIVKLEHSKEGVIKIPQIKGKTILVDADGNETDTPAEGCRLVSVGEEEDNKLIILSKNKNLIPFDNWILGKYISTSQGTIYSDEDSSYCEIYIKVKENEQYCLSSKYSFSKYIYFYTNEKEYINHKHIVNVTGTFTTPINCKYIRISLLNTEWFDKYDNIDLQLELGATKTEYVEQKQHKTEILLKEPLREGDYIEGKKIYRNVKQDGLTLIPLEEPIIEELPNSITLQGFDDTTMYIENTITPTVSYGYNALIPYKQELLNQKEEVETNTLDIEQNIIPYLMDMEFNLMLMEDN